MSQDKDNQYSSGYSGYSGSSQQTNDPYGGQEQQQYGGYQQQQQQQQQQQYVPPSSYTQSQQQQYSSYQAPTSAAIGASAYDPTSTGWSARFQAMVTYLLGWSIIGPIIFFVIERKNRFARFAAAQSFLFSAAAWIVYYILHLLSGLLGAIPLIGLLLGPVVGFVSTILGILFLLIGLYMALQAYRGKTVRLPFFSGYAENLVERTTRRI